MNDKRDALLTVYAIVRDMYVMSLAIWIIWELLIESQIGIDLDHDVFLGIILIFVMVRSEYEDSKWFIMWVGISLLMAFISSTLAHQLLWT
jgi:hypothetical protein